MSPPVDGFLRVSILKEVAELSLVLNGFKIPVIEKLIRVFSGHVARVHAFCKVTVEISELASVSMLVNAEHVTVFPLI